MQASQVTLKEPFVTYYFYFRYFEVTQSYFHISVDKGSVKAQAFTENSSILSAISLSRFEYGYIVMKAVFSR